jgi:type II secretory pathway component GspD/PulD (secretin)
MAPNGASPGGMGVFHSITFEPDTNTLIVVGDATAIQAAAKLVEHFDSNPVPAYEVKILFLRTVDAEKAAKLLNETLKPPAPDARLPDGGWFRAVGHAESNNVVIAGDVESVKIASEIAARLEVVRETPTNGVHVYRLQHSNAQKDATLLKELFNLNGYRAGATPEAKDADPQHDWFWNVVADDQSNSLIVVSWGEATAPIERLIEELDKAPAASQPVK